MAPSSVYMGMPRALRTPHFSGAIFHVISRGNAKQTVFFEDEDYLMFLSILRELKSRCPFKLHAFCLMPNHVHLLMQVDQVSVSVLVQYLLSRYSVWLNQRTGRVGHVFQGRFKSILCDRDIYLMNLIRYIHLNPVKAGVVTDPGDWPWSSHADYLGRKDPLSDPAWILSLLSSDSEKARKSYLGLMAQPGLPKKFETYHAAMRQPLLSSEGLGVLNSLGETVALAHEATLAGICQRNKEHQSCVARKALIRLASRRGFTPKQLAEYLNCTVWAIRKSLQG